MNQKDFESALLDMNMSIQNNQNINKEFLSKAYYMKAIIKTILNYDINSIVLDMEYSEKVSPHTYKYLDETFEKIRKETGT